VVTVDSDVIGLGADKIERGRILVLANVPFSPFPIVLVASCHHSWTSISHHGFFSGIPF
jgi:hypothetical protein